MITCRELIDFLDSYLNRALPAAQHRSFEEHLHACPPCVAYTETYEASVELARAALSASADEVPADVPAELVHAILLARKKAE